MEEKVAYPVHFLTRMRDAAQSVPEEIEQIVADVKPDVIVLFTDQHLSAIDRIFLASTTREISFKSSLPMLSINKSVAVAKDLEYLYVAGGEE